MKTIKGGDGPLVGASINEVDILAGAKYRAGRGKYDGFIFENDLTDAVKELFENCGNSGFISGNK